MSIQSAFSKGPNMPRLKTVVLDSVGEVARLFFSKSMNKHADDFETIRAVNHYPGATERLNILFRRLQDLRQAGVNVVIIGHEQIDKIYAKGGGIAAKGQQPSEPIGVRGIPDLPGSTAPKELLRKCDIIVRMRLLNGVPTWVAREEALGIGGDSPWVTGARFNGLAIKGGYWPASYAELESLARTTPNVDFRPPYIWMIYGRVKVGKTRTIPTFPKPLRLYDLDRGSSVLGDPEKLKAEGIEIVTFNPEETNDYSPFISSIASCFA